MTELVISLSLYINVHCLVGKWLTASKNVSPERSVKEAEWVTLNDDIYPEANTDPSTVTIGSANAH